MNLQFTWIYFVLCQQLAIFFSKKNIQSLNSNPAIRGLSGKWNRKQQTTNLLHAKMTMNEWATLLCFQKLLRNFNRHHLSITISIVFREYRIERKCLDNILIPHSLTQPLALVFECITNKYNSFGFYHQNHKRFAMENKSKAKQNEIILFRDRSQRFLTVC